MYQVEASTAASSIDSPPSMPTEPTPPVNTISQDVKLTPSELQEFDSIMLELDPDQQLVTKITQQKLSNTVNVTIGPGFMTLSQDRKYEIAVAMRTGLSQVCLCSPYLKFNSEDGQPLVEIDQYLEWQ